MRSLLLLPLVVTGTASALQLSGTGASFPAPLYQKNFSEYAKTTRITTTYDASGSSKGQEAILNRTVDFGASDSPMTNETLGKSKSPILHIPTALGAVVPLYNIPGVRTYLRLDGQVLADIFLGNITRWNDPAIAKLNPSLPLPAMPITVVRRSDGSGTTAVFTDFLSKVSPQWKTRVGSSTTVNWPVGVSAKGNKGVAETVQRTSGAIGYAEMSYAVSHDLKYASVRNAAGHFIKADIKTATAAAAAVPLPSDARVSITNAPGEYSYPISSYTFVLVYQNQQYGTRTLQQAQATRDLLRWMVTSAQKNNEGLHYAKLPPSAQQRATMLLNSMTFGSQILR